MSSLRRWSSLPLFLSGVVGCRAAKLEPAPPPPPTMIADAGSRAPDAGAPSDLAVAAASDLATPPPAPTAFITTDDLTQALGPVTITFGAAMADVTITVDATTHYQSIVGFGADITDSSAYVMASHLSASALHDLLVKLFDPTLGVGLSFLRQPMGASDFSSAGNFSYDDTSNDINLTQFNITQDLKTTIPILKQALAIDPGLFIMASPWSPPAWMKLNGSMDGSGGAAGNSGLAANAYQPLAQYFVKFVQAYAAQGIPVAAVTPQNEPLNGTANYPGMDFNQPSETSFIGKNLGPALAAAQLKTFIWAYDHNWDVESYPAGVMGDATAGPFSEGAAFHCYGGDPSAMTTFHDAFPQKSVYMTECSGGAWQGDPFANTIDLIIDSTSNWARAVALWNMALDEKAGPQNHGCGTCRGVVTIDSKSGAITYNVDYYALGHFSRFVRPGALRVKSTASDGALKQVAFVNGDGTLALIAHNAAAAPRVVQVGAGAAAMSVSVPANAAVTLRWSPTHP
jgi:glucosylceramidase